MAFDFGMSRIGVAIGDSVLQIPHPVVVITGKNKFEKFAKIQQLVDKWHPELFVVGIPEAGGGVQMAEDKFCLHPNDSSDGNLENLVSSSGIRRDDSANTFINQEKLQLITNIKRFSNRLKEKFKLDVKFVNEEYSSAMASSKLHEQNIFAKKQKDKLDAMSATIILQRYFDVNPKAK